MEQLEADIGKAESPHAREEQGRASGRVATQGCSAFRMRHGSFLGSNCTDACLDGAWRTCKAPRVPASSSRPWPLPHEGSPQYRRARAKAPRSKSAIPGSVAQSHDWCWTPLQEITGVAYLDRGAAPCELDRLEKSCRASFVLVAQVGRRAARRGHRRTRQGHRRLGGGQEGGHGHPSQGEHQREGLFVCTGFERDVQWDELRHAFESLRVRREFPTQYFKLCVHPLLQRGPAHRGFRKSSSLPSRYGYAW